jgi:hypothetical protein
MSAAPSWLSATQQSCSGDLNGYGLAWLREGHIDCAYSGQEKLVLVSLLDHMNKKSLSVLLLYCVGLGWIWG